MFKDVPAVGRCHGSSPCLGRVCHVAAETLLGADRGRDEQDQSGRGHGQWEPSRRSWASWRRCWEGQGLLSLGLSWVRAEACVVWPREQAGGGGGG